MNGAIGGESRPWTQSIAVRRQEDWAWAGARMLEEQMLVDSLAYRCKLMGVVLAAQTSDVETFPAPATAFFVGVDEGEP
jgi:hypothetical protein